MSAVTDGVYDFSAMTIDGAEQKLELYRGQVLLIVNVASQCGFTPQYAGLESLHRRLGEAGLSVLGFPCDQFGHQEPGDEAQIRHFTTCTYAVTFPLFAKVDVNGPGAHPLFVHLKNAARGLLGSQAIKWNFTKFLVGRDGRVVRRYAPMDTPESLSVAIERLI